MIDQEFAEFAKAHYSPAYFHGKGYPGQMNYNIGFGGEWYDQFVDWLMTAPFDIKDSVIADIGSSVGSFANVWLKRGAKLVYVNDVAEHAIELCKLNLKAFSNVEYILEECHRLKQIPSASVDFLFTAEVIEHINPDRSFDTANEFARIMKPGALAYVQGMFGISGDTIQGMKDACPDPGHINLKMGQEWVDIFAHEGLFIDVESFARLHESERVLPFCKSSPQRYIVFRRG